MASDPTTAAPPSQTAAIAALFGPAFHWVRGFNLNALIAPIHHGVDLAAPKGTPIPAASSGKVIWAGDYERGAPRYISAEGGKQVLVLTSTGLVDVYAHLDSVNVRPGDVISQHTIIGAVGDTTGGPNASDVTGPHLHFGVYDTNKGTYIDPVPYLTSLPAELGAWNNIVSFPVGHVLTCQGVNGQPSDIDTIIAQLDNAHWFSGGQTAPIILQQLAENTARDTARAILMRHCGQEWNKGLQDTLSQEFGTAATDANTGALQDIAATFGKLLDPQTYVRTGAFLIGLTITVIGFKMLMEASAGSPTTVE